MGLIANYAIGLIFLALSQGVHALFEDQIGKFDWRHQYVGRARFVLFDTGSAAVKKIITATEQNVLAAINAKTGQIEWRQLLERQESSRIDDVKLNNGNVFVVTGGGTYVRCFTAAVGDLLWEHNVEYATTEHTAQLVINDDLVYILAGDKVVAFSFDSLQSEWSTQLPGSVPFSHLGLVKDSLLAIGVSKGQVSVARLNRLDGQVEAKRTLPALWAESDQPVSCQIIASSLLCVHQSMLYSLPLGDNSASLIATPLQALGITASTAKLLPQQEEDSPFALLRLSPSGTALVEISNTGVPRLVSLNSDGATIQMLTHIDTALAVTVTRQGEEAELKVVSAESGKKLDDLSLMVSYPSHHGTPTQIYGLSFKKRDGTPVLKFMILSEDHSMVMLHTSGRLAWTREESLASIVSMEMVDYPVSPILAKMEDEFRTSRGVISMFVNRIATQVAQLKALIEWAWESILHPGRHSRSRSVAEGDVLDDLSRHVTDQEDSEPTRDDFSLHKMLTLVTSAGKLFGLRSETGLPEWKHYLPNAGPFSVADNEPNLPLFIQRTTAHFPNRPVATVVAKNRQIGGTILYSFDPITGEESKEDDGAMSIQLNSHLRQLTMLSHMSDNFVRPLLLLDDKDNYHVYPKSLKSFVRQLSPSLFMYTADATTSAIAGYNVKRQGEALIAQELWRVSLAAPQGQHLVNVMGKRAQENLHSQGVVLGDRSVLYKYANPNLLVAATVSPLDASGKGSVNLYLVDAVTGHILYHVSHKKARGPVHVVHSENWVVYSYWNDRFRRTEIGVLEMYEGSQQSNVTHFSSQAPPPQPIVSQQAYILNAHVTAASHTITEQGLTNKQVLLALEMGGLLGLPKAFIDARRPLVPTEESREEGLMPYIPELPVIYEMFLNYNQSVFAIRGIHTAPAGLESTSLVLCYGLDLFFTRVTPSKMFDVLKEDFEYFFISSVLGGMILVSIITRKLAMRKTLSRSWK